jgi:hypothetical protein
MLEERTKMSMASGLMEVENHWEPPVATPLDEAVWQAWVARGRAEDRRGNEARAASVQWVLIAVLVAAAGLWSQLAPYSVAFRFIVFAGAITAAFHAFGARRYGFAAAFGALALLYNPVAPVFDLSGDWQRALVGASAAPFIASIAWRNMKVASHA